MDVTKKITYPLLSVIAAVIAADFGKHWWIKSEIEKRCHLHPERFQAEHYTVDFLPFHSRVVLKNVTTTHGLKIEQLAIRQNLMDLKKLSFNGKKLSFNDVFSAAMMKSKIEIHPSIYRFSATTKMNVEAVSFRVYDAQINLKDLVIKSKKISMPWDYQEETKTFKPVLRPSDFMMNDQAILSLNGKGTFSFQEMAEGSMILNVKGISGLVENLKKSGFLNDFQANLLSFGSGLLSGDHGEIPLVLSLHENLVSLGLIPLFKIS